MQGVVHYWNPKKSIGIIDVPTSGPIPSERFYLHASSIRTIPVDCVNPIGYIATFDVIELRTSGLRRAINVHLSWPQKFAASKAPDAGAAALGGDQ